MKKVVQSYGWVQLLIFFFAFALKGNAQQLLNKIPMGDDTVFVVKHDGKWILKDKKEWNAFVKHNFHDEAYSPLVNFVAKEILRAFPKEIQQSDVFKFDCGITGELKSQNVLVARGLNSEKALSNFQPQNHQEAFSHQLAIWENEFPTLNAHEYTSWEEAIENPNCVQILALTFQNLKSVPEGISQFPNLKELYLSGNQIKSLPHELFLCKNLRILHLDENLISAIPENIKNLTALQELNLSQNALRDLPAELFFLPRITDLNLSNNPISMYAFPEGIGNFLWLQKLNIFGCQIDCFPGVMSSLENLEEVIVGSSCMALYNNECSKVSGTVKMRVIEE